MKLRSRMIINFKSGKSLNCLYSVEEKEAYIKNLQQREYISLDYDNETLVLKTSEIEFWTFQKGEVKELDKEPDKG